MAKLTDPVFNINVLNVFTELHNAAYDKAKKNGVQEIINTMFGKPGKIDDIKDIDNKEDESYQVIVVYKNPDMKDDREKFNKETEKLQENAIKAFELYFTNSGGKELKQNIPTTPDEIDGPHRIKRIQDIIIEDGKAKPKEVNMEEKDEKFVYFSMSYNITTKL